MQELGARSRGSGNVYFTGGATALLLGIREQTIDVDLKLDPEPQGAFDAIYELKRTLELNVELVSPMDFVPVTADWKQRSLYIEREGEVSFFHFDLRAQVLSKIERGYAQDLDDAREFLRVGGISGADLRSYFGKVRSDLVRYPGLDADDLSHKLDRFLAGL